jgi:hypothetical protein
MRGTSLSTGCLHAWYLVKYRISRHGVVLSQVQARIHAGCLGTGHVFVVWCLVKYMVHLHYMVLR